MAANTKWLTIGRVAKAAGVNVETIRYYQRRGLLRVPSRPLGGVRAYNGDDVAQVVFVKAAQRLGFSLEEAGQLLQLDTGMQCRAASDLGARHLADVRARLKDLRRMEVALVQLLKRCAERRGKVACPLIAALKADVR